MLSIRASLAAIVLLSALTGCFSAYDPADTVRLRTDPEGLSAHELERVLRSDPSLVVRVIPPYDEGWGIGLSGRPEVVLELYVARDTEGASIYLEEEPPALEISISKLGAMSDPEREAALDLAGDIAALLSTAYPHLPPWVEE